YTVTSTGNKFKVTRSDSSTVETVRYRTIGWNAIAGKHFTAKSDTLNFEEGVGTRYVTVNEPTVSSIDPKYRYQTTTTRLYRFQVLDLNGFLLAQASRSISMGSGHQINTTKIFTTEDLSPTSLHSTTNPIVVTDGGYAQDYHSFPISNFFSNHVPREYISIMDAQLIMLIEMEVAESDDGYQYIQVLVDDETHVDTGAGSGDPGGTNYSIFKAGFGHKPGSEYKTYEKYCFPAPNCYNLIKDEDRCYPWKYDPYNNSYGYIYRQFFKTVGTDYNYYVSFYDGGWIKLPIDLQTVGVRLNASGDFGDTWYAKDLTAKVRAWDNRSPYVIPGDIVVSPGPYNKDNTVYVQIPMNEIVVVTGNPKLKTTWGELTYAYGTGSNVLTFSGKITADAGTQLKLNYIETPSGVSIKGLNGYTYDDLEEKTFNYYSTEDYVLNNDNVEITKHFTEPLIDNGVNKPVAFTVKWRTKTLTEGVDYTLSYRNNYGPLSGTTEGTVEVNGIGKYSGTATGTFTIRAVEISDFTEIEPNVYQIANRDDLMHLSGYVSNGKHNCGGLTFLQTANIDVDGEFLPIGGNSRTRPEFTGTYDGQGYTISGIDAHPDPYSVDSRHWIGLFGHLANKNGNQGTLKNIVLANSTFTGFEDVGAIAARNFSSVITNCRVESNVIVNKYVSNADQHGGIVGTNDFGRIEGCVSAAVLNSNVRVGGLVGNITGGLISNNLYTGTSVISGSNVGALIGQRYTGLNNPTLTNNYYVDSNQPGGFNGSDVDGARFGRTITLAPNIAIVGDTVEYDVSGLTAIGNSVLIHGDTIYSGYGQTVTVAPAHGADYRVSNVIVMNGNTPVEVTSVEDGIFSFVMPAGDVSITAELQPRYTFDSETGVLALLWGEFNNGNKWDDVEPAAVTSVTATADVSFTGNCNALFRNFTNCTNMDLSLVNTDSLRFATNMFYGCEKLETLDVSGWNTSNVTDMSDMFCNCYKLSSLDVSGWNTANVSRMAYMFRSCKELSSLDVSGWNTANVNDMSFMFYCCNKLDSLDVSGWDTASVTDMRSLFNSCSRLG
ncbi:MAG: DUF285 domain-containing protein, partial [Muribaculaceae bacterium]|nr:DUF285 domain-containing protein [Muribaculaceae bacterium]